jgi:hypothetical protein
MTDRCSFCARADLPLAHSKHAATGLECARLAVEVLAAPAKTIHCERVAPCPRGGHGHPCVLAPDHAGNHSTPGCGDG